MSIHAHCVIIWQKYLELSLGAMTIAMASGNIIWRMNKQSLSKDKDRHGFMFCKLLSLDFGNTNFHIYAVV
ncbi:hypothetical protein Hanom_Chr12g01067851 [Helianthus anomalus]